MVDTTGLKIRPIARVSSPYQEKFGVPRQPGLVPAAVGYLEILPAFARPEAFEGIEGFSHLWVVFGFSACEGRFRLRVRPPRLGGNEERGVFATRSPFRPNNLGLSVLAFDGMEAGPGGVRLHVSGLDLIDGTPVYDIKPYVPYTDCIAGARSGFAGTPPQEVLEVVFSQEAESVLEASGADSPALRDLICQTLSLDPRPAYRGDGDRRRYGMRLSGYDVRWHVQGEQVWVDEIVPQ